MLRFLRKLIQSKPRPKLSHPILGELQLEQGAKGPYWLREAYHEGELTISVDTVEEAAPSQAQVEFFQWATGDLESIYLSVASELTSQHNKMQGKPVQADWRQTFRLAGLGIPHEGNKQLPWDITFECLTDGSGNLYTCYFENGTLAHVSIDT